MSGALLEQFIAALGCPCAPSLEPILKPFPRVSFHTMAVAGIGFWWEFCLPGSHKVESLWAFHSVLFAAANLELMMC